MPKVSTTPKTSTPEPIPVPIAEPAPTTVQPSPTPSPPPPPPQDQKAINIGQDEGDDEPEVVLGPVDASEPEEEPEMLSGAVIPPIQESDQEEEIFRFGDFDTVGSESGPEEEREGYPEGSGDVGEENSVEPARSSNDADEEVGQPRQQQAQEEGEEEKAEELAEDRSEIEPSALVPVDDEQIVPPPARGTSFHSNNSDSSSSTSSSSNSKAEEGRRMGQAILNLLKSGVSKDQQDNIYLPVPLRPVDAATVPLRTMEEGSALLGRRKYHHPPPAA